ncbi:ROK family transcriptional regulator [Actinokineospora bangkokensis]|uniref:ROK family protein n=1 Tax=Actinokineospora bangkokensis TaxID=1193682 RepID=A0A1Q9LQM2_9PSEU|nr:ROK family transcriptional regulator [Actinokineospora bangkokensis]OLR94329.1 hypothetical protein BJP25_11205 [Actinokineospora bangkokensis]
MRDLPERARAVLRAAHDRPGLTRADAARLLGMGSGAVTEAVARLTAGDLLAEAPAAPSGARGRPTTTLVPHPGGPVVLAAAISHEGWRVDAVQLGGTSLTSRTGTHGGSWPRARDGLRAAVRALHRAPGRVAGLGLSVPGTVLDGHRLDATILGWREVDLRTLWPGAEVFAADNDATLAGLAEARRGAAAEAALALHVLVAAGLGGALLDRGRVVAGARGVAGEFGHMPFGPPDLACPCGASGCWGAETDAIALSTLVDGQAPEDPVTRAKAILAAAAAPGRERDAAVVLARRLGRGLAALVNSLDPDLITLGGLAVDLLVVAPEPLFEAYRGGLMAYRRQTPTPVIPAALGDSGPLTGAAEVVWDRLLAPPHP